MGKRRTEKRPSDAPSGDAIGRPSSFSPLPNRIGKGPGGIPGRKLLKYSNSVPVKKYRPKSKVKINGNRRPLPDRPVKVSHMAKNNNPVPGTLDEIIVLPTLAEMRKREIDQRDILQDNAGLLINRAIRVALDPETPNVQVLIKLLDKIVPTLTSSTIDARIKRPEFQNFSDQELNDMVQTFSQIKSKHDKEGKQ